MSKLGLQSLKLANISSANMKKCTTSAFVERIIINEEMNWIIE
jgi:hypothetical protein